MTTLLERGRAGTPLRDIEVIDMHAHLGVRVVAVPDTSPEALVASMDRCGIDVTVVTTSGTASEAYQDRENADVHDACRAHPDRLLGYYRAWPSPRPVSYTEAQRRLTQGFAGLKLHAQLGADYTHPSYEPYLAVANDHRMPVLFHCWGQEAELSAIQEISKRHADASLLVAHTGSANEPGYIALARECANVHLELALSFSPRGLVDRLVEAVGVEKVVWGSDACLFSQGQQLGKVLGARISDEQKIRILGGNARRILDRAQR